MEILCWISDNLRSIKGWISIDDMILSDTIEFKAVFKRHQVVTTMANGLDEEKTQEAIKILNSDKGAIDMTELDGLLVPTMKAKTFKVNVPYYTQTTMLNCGPTALQMILDSYELDRFSFDKIEEMIDIHDGEGTFCLL